MPSDLAVHAPELSPDLEWLNTARKLSLRELRGHVVVLDFWTYCCINCMHVIPVLRRIEERYAGQPVVVIGVHSAKFDEEKDAARIEEAMRRYGVDHPVVVDRDMQTWSAFAVRSWPTLIVLRPDGTIAAVAPGEPELDALSQVIGDELAIAKKKGTLAKQRIELHASKVRDAGALSFPGKVAIAADGRIAVADSGHHRVLVLDGAGHVLHVIGSGLAGHGDGPFNEAAFDDPQGLVWQEDHLFIADARAHTIVRADLTAGVVTTIAGTGELGASPLGEASPALETALRSPWDLWLSGDRLYVAMAGSHQIAVLDLAANTIARVGGTGAESIVDGPLDSATFSQPSGLASAAGKLYVADSETSAVRELDLVARSVRTVVGRGLFDFGDRDGPRDVALMQHCIGIGTGPEGALVVCDTYNGKLRVVDRLSGAVKTLAAGFSEPAGIAWDEARESFIVADTNAHRLVRVSRDGAKKTVVEVDAPPPAAHGRMSRPPPPSGSMQTAWFSTLFAAREGAALGAGVAHAEITLAVTPPEGRKFAAGSPLHLTIEVSRRSDLIVLAAPARRVAATGGSDEQITIAARIEAFAEEHIEAEVVIRIDGVVCDAGAATAEGAVCEPYRAWLRLPVRLAQGGVRRVEFVAGG